MTKYAKYIVLSLFFITFFNVVSVLAASVSSMRFGSYSNLTQRIVLEMTNRADPKVFFIENPDRLVVDFNDTHIENDVKTTATPENPIVESIRFGAPEKGVSRMVVDLKDKAKQTHFLLPPQNNVGVWRFVLDVAPIDIKKAQAQAKRITQIQTTPATIDRPMQKLGNVSVSPWQPAKATPKAYVAPLVDKMKEQQTPKIPPKSTPTPTKSTVAQQKIVEKAVGLQPFKKQQKIIMLDPGHGGKDPGAISKSGHYEKDLTLKMAFETKKILEKSGYKVVMTRYRDEYIPLRTRIDKAHRAKADLFISIHADSTKNPKAKGLSIYTISEKASDAEAAALADRENQADILLDMDLKSYQKEVSSVLIDLAKQESMKESRRYAQLVVDNMRRQVQLVPNAHRFAGFVVLKSPNIPSVLLEMGYLSNVQEEKLLQKSAYREKLAKALVNAVDLYFK